MAPYWIFEQSLPAFQYHVFIVSLTGEQRPAVLREEVKSHSNEKKKQRSFFRSKHSGVFFLLETIEEGSNVERWQVFKEFPPAKHDFSLLARIIFGK